MEPEKRRTAVIAGVIAACVIVIIVCLVIVLGCSETSQEPASQDASADNEVVLSEDEQRDLARRDESTTSTGTSDVPAAADASATGGQDASADTSAQDAPQGDTAATTPQAPSYVPPSQSPSGDNVAGAATDDGEGTWTDYY